MRARSLLAAIMMALSLAYASETAIAADLAVDLELVLAVDVSRSMDKDEQLLQRQGYAAAFRDALLIEAVRDGANKRIAVTYVEWAGRRSQLVIVPWRLIADSASAESFAAEIAGGVPRSLDHTSISRALAFSGQLFATNRFAGRRRVIDISGDGPNNSGEPVAIARNRLVAEGIVINGLPIQIREALSGGIFDYEHLDRYYRDCVIGGVGAFIVTVREADGFAIAIRRKLLLEVAGLVPRLVRIAQGSAPPEPVDCLIGEKRWRSWIGPGGLEP